MAIKNMIVELTAGTDGYKDKAQIKTIVICPSNTNWALKLVDSTGATITNVFGAAKESLVIPLNMNEFVDNINVATWTNITSVQISIA